MPTWLQLFWGFVKIGILGYGGGPGSISIIQSISVDTYHWMSTAQFAEMLAIGNALPGPIATKLAGAIGYRTAGPVGAISAVLGVILPSLILMISLYQILLIFRTNPYVIGLIRGVKPVVIALLVLLIVDLVPSSFPKSRWIIPIIFFVVSLIMIRGLKISPAWVILASMIGGTLFLR